MSNTIEGRVILALPETRGVSKSGKEWIKREYVIEQPGTFPRQVKVDFFGDAATQYPLNVGEDVKVYIDIESREYNGRFYTDVHGWKVEKKPVDAGAPQAAPQAPQSPDAAPIDGLPF